MKNFFRSGTRPEQTSGVALPVALFGLIVVSILVSSALVTSSTELALSRAHQTGTEELYAADSALESFVAQRAAMTENTEERMVTGTYPASTPGGKSFSISVAELFRGIPQAVPGGFQRSEVFSLVASPSSGRGRSTGTFLELYRFASDISFHIDSGLTLGGDGAVSGDAFISDGSGPGSTCDSASAETAVRHAAATQVNQQGSGFEIHGGVVQDTSDASQLMEHVLNGHDLNQLTELATFRFGPMFGEAVFTGEVSQSAGSVDHQWGCPALLVGGCTLQQSAFYPTVVIDAAGGTVDLAGDHGQGILVVRNGNLHLGGDLRFAGIVLVEGKVYVSGSSRVDGGIVAMGNVPDIVAGEGSSMSGSSAIHFNRCEIVEAQRSLTIASVSGSPQTMGSPTFAWFEVVR